MPYTVKDISRKLNVHQETVRRWIRGGKLASTQCSRREGDVISDDEFERFLQEHQKYSIKRTIILEATGMSREEFMKWAENEIDQVLAANKNRLMNVAMRAWAEGKRNAETESVIQVLKAAIGKMEGEESK